MITRYSQASFRVQSSSRTPHCMVQRHLPGSVTSHVHHWRTIFSCSPTRKQPVCQGLHTQALNESNIDIHSPYQLQEENIRCYRDSGFVRLPNVFDHTTLAHYTPTVSLEVANADKTPLEEDSDYQKAFTQVLLLGIDMLKLLMSKATLLPCKTLHTIFCICRSPTCGPTASQLRSLCWAKS